MSSGSLTPRTSSAQSPIYRPPDAMPESPRSHLTSSPDLLEVPYATPFIPSHVRHANRGLDVGPGRSLPAVAADPIPSYQFATPVFGIDTAPDGSLLVADAGAGIVELRKGVASLRTGLPGISDVSSVGRAAAGRSPV